VTKKGLDPTDGAQLIVDEGALAQSDGIDDLHVGVGGDGFLRRSCVYGQAGVT
jgi:hypothetical protein